ncbi:MAG: hypothetical protein ACYDA6_05915 [Solirubrobacteraceae bacterium]
MLKGEDIIVLLKLAQEPGAELTVRSLEADLGIPRTVIHRSLGRLGESGLIDPPSRRVNMSRAEELLVHATKYMFPAALEGETRGIPTAWAVSPLAGRLAGSGNTPPVWPEPKGKVRGLAVKPLHTSVSRSTLKNPVLYEELALIDALRLGDQRVAGLASELLRERLAGAAAAAAS